jgi:hypothetical protein
MKSLLFDRTTFASKPHASVACLFLLSLAESLVYHQTVESDRILASSSKVGQCMINMLNPLENLSNEVLRLSSETSEKYVPAPHKGQVLQDL